MIAILSFIGITALLSGEGHLLLRGITRRNDAVTIALSYPLGTLTNALVFFLAHILGLRWTLLSIGSIHGVLIIALLVWFLTRGRRKTAAEHERIPSSHLSPILASVCGIVALVALLSAALYALAFPTFFWDAFTNWAMRSMQSYQAQSLVFDGIAKAQYPILIHSLHVVFALPGGWSDRLANAATFLLSTTSLLTLFLLIRRQYGNRCALIGITLLLAIPLVVIHLRQGYADIHVTLFILLASLFLHEHVTSGDVTSLTISGLLAAAAAWTKLEGLYFALLPFIALALVTSVQRKTLHKGIRRGILPACVLGLGWVAFLLASGLPLSPHGSSVAFHPEAIRLVLVQLFVTGSFGVHWYAIALGIVALIVVTKRNPRTLLQDTPSLWGIGSLLLVLAIYLCTKEVEFLVSGNTFGRTALIPTMLLTQALWLRFGSKE
ncbi:MAG: glycosyltransferase family 39 protein [Candidatus Peregrinibacteria bacterium]|nr:glycosyltransferase family 39 protein [Candidatus Peregrinibacteria bacterium]